MDSKQAVANSIDEKISITQKAIEVGLDKIELTNKYIFYKKQEISKKENDIENTLQLFRDRVKAIYMTGGYSDTANLLRDFKKLTGVAPLRYRKLKGVVNESDTDEE